MGRGYGNDTVYAIGGGYELTIDWIVYPEATVTRGGERIARRGWVMTGWHFLPGWFSINSRIERWALKAVKRHEKMEHRLATRKLKFPQVVGKSYDS
jgi:hypothetical protein